MSQEPMHNLPEGMFGTFTRTCPCGATIRVIDAVEQPHEHPNGDTMPVTREARYLAGVDLGKNVEGTNNHGRHFNGTLHRVEQRWAAVTVQTDNERNDFTEFHTLAPTDTLIITGIPSPIVGPDCRDNKHRACDERALDETADQIITCQCTCHTGTEKP